jgi:hypothetical protein
MRRFIAWQNLERYRRLLAAEPDARRREVLEKLLAEEEKVWDGLVEKKPGEPKPTTS